jgi:hypothetical protein
MQVASDSFLFFCRILGACLVALVAPLLLSGQIEVVYGTNAEIRRIELPDGSAIQNGQEVRIGTFAPTFEVAANADDLALLNENWRAFHSSLTTTVDGTDGLFAASHVATENAADFVGKTIYLWILKRPRAGIIDSSIDSVTAYGLYTSDEADWVFPSEEPLSNSVIINGGDVNTAFFGSLTPEALILGETPDASGGGGGAGGGGTVPDPTAELPGDDLGEAILLSERWIGLGAYSLVYRSEILTDWFYSPWYGWFTVEDGPEPGYWMYLPALDWVWTSEEVFPVIFLPDGFPLRLGNFGARHGEYYDFSEEAWQLLNPGI